jgi:hypothetical protein
MRARKPLRRAVITVAMAAAGVAVPAVTAPAHASCTVTSSLYQVGNTIEAERSNSCTGDLNVTLYRDGVAVASGFGGASYTCTGTAATRWSTIERTLRANCS